jgi:hypothetical protein
MTDEKFYWSDFMPLDAWRDDDADCMTFVLIPRKWWSIKAWKMANRFRTHLLNKLMGGK